MAFGSLGPQDLSMLLKKIYLIAISITIILVGCGESTPTPDPDPLIVNLRELLDMRDQNEVAMDSKYKGQFVEMQGIVEEIHDGDIKILPLDSDLLQMSGAVCKFEKANPVMIERLQTIIKGDVGIIRGTIKDIDDFMFTEIEIDPCLLVLTPSNSTSMESELSKTSDAGEGNMVKPATTGPAELNPDVKAVFLDGSGMQATSLFVLSEGLWIVKFEHSGDKSFEVVMFDENGEMASELIQEEGHFSGSRILSIDKEAKFLLQVTADGDWMVDIVPPTMADTGTKSRKKEPVAMPTVIEKIIEVEVPVEVEKIVEVEVLVEVEKIVEVEVPVEVEKIVEVEVLVEVEKIVIVTPTPTPVSVTALPMPSIDLIPTATPVPTSTPTPLPTATPTPLPTATPTPTPLPTPTPTPVPIVVRLIGQSYQAVDGVEINIASITKTPIQIDSTTTGQTVQVVYTMRNTSATYVREQKGFTLYYQGGGAESQNCSGCTVIQPGVTISVSHTFTLTDPTSPWILGYPTRPTGYWAASDLIWVIE